MNNKVIEKKIFDIIAELNKTGLQILPKTDLFQIGVLDSFGILGYIQRLEEVFDVVFNETDLKTENFCNITATISLLKKRMKELIV